MTVRLRARARVAAATLIATIAACSADVQPVLAQATGQSQAGTAGTRAQPKLFDLALRTREARLAGDHKAWLENGRRVLAMAPEHPDLLISVGRALAANGRTDEAMDHLEDAIRRGAGFTLDFPEFKAAAGNARLEALRARAARQLAPVAPAEVFATIADPDVRAEGIAYDVATSRLYVGSLNGEIWQVDLQGRAERFAGPGTGLLEVLGVKVDPVRRWLWAVTGVFPDLLAGPEPKEGVGSTGVHAYELDTRKRVRECPLDERPILHGFNDLALASNGDVYVSDSTEGAIYRLPGGHCKLERLLQDDTVSFPNGIALDAGEKRLYVAHIEGISAVDVKTGQRTLLPVPATGNVNSIDGLAFDGPDLLGIQGSPYLARTARIRLSEDGLAVREVETVSSRPTLGANQTTGVVVGDTWYSVAGLVPDAAPPPGPGEPPRRTRILRVKLR
jgi:sugar lactone lactonase YvrE